MDTFTTPTVRRGPAGALVATTTTHYAGEEPSTVSFHGSTYGGPVVMAWGDTSDRQTFVSDRVTDRIGHRFEANPVDWVRGFFSDLEETAK